jgi:hypothetical protein
VRAILLDANRYEGPRLKPLWCQQIV